MRIFYTGVGAKKSGVHTVKEFVDMMNKTSCEDCNAYIINKNAYEKSSVCKKWKKMDHEKYFEKPTKRTKSKKFDKQYKEYDKKCNKYKKTLKRKKKGNCDLDDYIEYSGARKE